MRFNQKRNDRYENIWSVRKSAIESVLGPSDRKVLHSIVPFHIGGAADVIYFRKHVCGRMASTCELLGEKSQIRNSIGNYELIIAQRDESKWGPQLIAKLARYTCESRLEPGHTMDIVSLVPKSSTLVGLLFTEYARFDFERINAGLLLCIGITASEMQACRRKGHSGVLNSLKSENVYPYTDLFRCSII